MRERQNELRLSNPALSQALEMLFGEQPALVPATLNNALGARLDALNTRCAALQRWASAASFPLPTAFSSGLSVVNELTASPTPVARLPLFGERYQQLSDLLELLDQLEAFHQSSGLAFPQVRDYFTAMINAGLHVPELQTFLRAFNTLQSERRFYDRPRWQELVRARDAAETAVTAQLARWVAEAP